MITIDNEVAILSDLHFGIRDDNVSFLSHQIEVLKDFLNECKKRKIKYIIQLGDFNHHRKQINIRTLNIVKSNFLKVLEKEGITLILLAGNHDNFYTNTSDITSIEIFEEFKNIIVIKNNMIMSANGIKFSLIPWISDNGLDKFKSFIEQNKTDIVFSHMEINQFQVMPGVTMMKGIDIDLLKNFKRVITGHFHNKQFKDNIYYIGAGTHFTWNDYDYEKGFYFYNFAKDELDFVENKKSLFKKIMYDESKLDELMIDLDDNSDKIIKIYVQEKIDDVKFDNYINELEKINPQKFTIIEKDDYDITTEAEVIDENKNIIQIFDDYLEELNHPKKVILKKIMEKLYNEVMNISKDE